MDAVNRMLLDRIQRSFPLVPEPYRALSEGLSIDGDEVRRRIGELKAERLVRQISAIFNTGAVGYRSSLVALAVPEDALDRAADVVNAYPGVSHNYLRPGAYNMWFTIAVPPGESLEAVVQELAARAGGWPVRVLPALKKYKLEVVLDVLEEGEGEPANERSGALTLESAASFDPTAENIRIVRRIQEDLPLVERPFLAWAEELGMTERALLGLMETWIGQGVVRRFAAVLNHRRAGFHANGMVVWNVPVDRIDACGRALSAYPEVSHCYYRPSYPDWPYNLYAMIHGRTREDCGQVAEKLAEVIGLHDQRILFSTREFKKIRLKLFWA